MVFFRHDLRKTLNRPVRSDFQTNQLIIRVFKKINNVDNYYLTPNNLFAKCYTYVIYIIVIRKS